MKYQSVLIVTYGRSGSTLLQGLLNSIDGCVVRGENFNLCHGLFKAFESLHNTYKDYGKTGKTSDATSPWFGAQILDEERFLEDARDLISHQLIGGASLDPHVTCYGFKEIRYLTNGFAGGKKELKDYLAFLCRLFPKPAIVVLTRKHEQVSNSAWWKSKDPSAVTELLSAFEDAVGEFSDRRDNVYFLTYDDMITRSERVVALFDFLGAAYDEARVRQVLETRHSYADQSGNGAHQTKTRYQTRLTECDAVAYSMVDPVHWTADGTHVRIGGVVLPTADTLAGAKLLLVAADEERAIEWGLPSPKVGARLPKSAVAAHARFRIDVEPWREGAAELVLMDTNGNRYTIALIGPKAT